MKKFLFILCCILLSGCTISKLDKIKIDTINYPNNFDGCPIGITEDCVYYMVDEDLYVKKDNELPVSLGSVNYLDGNKAHLSVLGAYRCTQTDTFSGCDLICYGDRIYLVYQTDKFDGSSYFSLCSVNSKGEDFKTHIIFDFVPQRIKMNNGLIYVLYYDINNLPNINIYNGKFKFIETKTYEENTNALGFYILNNEIVVPDKFCIYDSNDIKVTYQIENLGDSDEKIFSTYKNGELNLIFENKFILFVTDDYFYTSSCIYPQIYERYHLNGELDQSIVIKDYIESKGETSSLFASDFSYIVKMRNEDIAYGHSGEHIFEVNFKDGTCKYIDE